MSEWYGGSSSWTIQKSCRIPSNSLSYILGEHFNNCVYLHRQSEEVWEWSKWKSLKPTVPPFYILGLHDWRWFDLLGDRIEWNMQLCKLLVVFIYYVARKPEKRSSDWFHFLLGPREWDHPQTCWQRALGRCLPSIYQYAQPYLFAR